MTIPQTNLIFPLQVITQSPIIIRIPIEKYQNKITNTAPYKSLFWRSDHPVDLFIEALESNLEKKYKEFTSNQFQGRIFEGFDFQKQVSTKINVSKSNVPIIGTLWKLEFASDVPRDLQLFALDCGLGERNSIGFGFVNPKIQKKN
jgi:CRISPR-associated endoribonuclease Cas6